MFRAYALAGLLLPAVMACSSPSQAGSLESDTSRTPCATALESASRLNAMALIEGALACAEEGLTGEFNLLLLLGQIRGHADLTILPPADDNFTPDAMQLATMLYNNPGTLGFEDFYRDPANVTELEERIRGTDLPFTPDYDPGWNFDANAKTDVYPDIVAYQREYMIWYMLSVARRIQDDEYWKAYSALNELYAANPTIQHGTEIYAEVERLRDEMRIAAQDIPSIPKPEDTRPLDRLYEQEPDLADRQVAVGFNGPAMPTTDILRSRTEVLNSWLSAALPDDELEALIVGTDFETQALLAYSFGERMNASGQIIISKLSYSESRRGYTISTRIGVVAESCGIPFTASYPFVVGLVEAVPGADVNSSSSSNFGDECGPIMSGAPVAQR